MRLWLGRDDELAPRVLFEPSESRGGVRAGSEWLVETTPQGEFHVVDWDSGESVATAWQQGTSANVPRIAGDTMYFSNWLATLMLWTRQTGTVPLRAFQAPASGGASLGTDGHDLVWLEGRDLDVNAPDPIFATRDIYTAPFTTEPAALEPRRLRSWAGSLLDGTYPPIVGCSYAAFDDSSQINHAVVLVRLEDGVAWRLRSGSDKANEQWALPVALSWSELFVNFGDNLARIELAALGPGEQPD